MSAIDAIKQGQLQSALEQLQLQVRQNPADAKLRIFLFQLLLVLGQWERALNQLKVIAELDGLALPMVQTYREAIMCEFLRQDVFAGKRSPLVLGDPPAWFGPLLEALRHEAEGANDAAEQLRQQAFDAAPASAGQIDGQPFQWLADADPRLGPVLEWIANGRYYWVPWMRVQKLVIEAPADLRDQVWMPANLTLQNGGELYGLIPTRYPATVAQGDDSLLLARRTEWREMPGQALQALGQRMLATDVADFALMDVREICINNDSPS